MAAWGGAPSRVAMTHTYSLIISMFFRIGTSCEDTVKDIQQTFDMFPDFSHYPDRNQSVDISF
jgi:hypothetical protein